MCYVFLDVYKYIQIYFSQNLKCTPLKKDPYLYYLWILLFADTFLIYLFKYIYTTTGEGKPFLCFLVLYFLYSHFRCFLRKYSCFLFGFLWEVQQILIIGTFNLFFSRIRDMNYKYVLQIWIMMYIKEFFFFGFRIYSTKVSMEEINLGLAYVLFLTP